MKRTIFALTILALPAHADGIAKPRVEAEPAHAQCRILWGLLPCNEDRGPNAYTPREEKRGPLSRVPEWFGRGDLDPNPRIDTGQPMHGDYSGKDVSKGNASANNGKSGNYEKTGHQDNGKGKGREKK